MSLATIAFAKAVQVRQSPSAPWKLRATTIIELSILALFGLAAGLMIGCVGVGGVILVPLLSYVGGIAIHTAIAAAMFAYLISGAVGTMVFARQKSIRWDMTVPLWAGAMPAALIGALVVNISSAGILETVIGLLTIVSGIHSLRRRDDNDRENTPKLAWTGLTVIGAITGFFSALTGTGGPLVLIPLLMWLHLPVLTAIGLSQAIQLPIAVLATAGNAYAGSLDLIMGCAIGAGISLGTWAGGRLAHRLPRIILQRLVSVLLIVVGALILIRLGIHVIT